MVGNAQIAVAGVVILGAGALLLASGGDLKDVGEEKAREQAPIPAPMPSYVDITEPDPGIAQQALEKARKEERNGLRLMAIVEKLPDYRHFVKQHYGTRPERSPLSLTPGDFDVTQFLMGLIGIPLKDILDLDEKYPDVFNRRSGRMSYSTIKATSKRDPTKHVLFSGFKTKYGYSMTAVDTRYFALRDIGQLPPCAYSPLRLYGWNS